MYAIFQRPYESARLAGPQKVSGLNIPNPYVPLTQELAYTVFAAAPHDHFSRPDSVTSRPPR